MRSVQFRVDAVHDGECPDKCHDRDEDVLWTMVGKFPDIKKVIGNSAHNMARLRVVEKSERLPLYMGEQLLAHIGFNIDAEFVTKIADNILKERTQ